MLCRVGRADVTFVAFAVGTGGSNYIPEIKPETPTLSNDAKNELPNASFPFDNFMTEIKRFFYRFSKLKSSTIYFFQINRMH